MKLPPKSFIRLLPILTFLFANNLVHATPLNGFYVTNNQDQNALEERARDLRGDPNNQVQVIVETKSPATDQQCMALTTGCGECTALTGCGWCPTTGTCMAGDENGPALISCPASLQHGQWAFGQSASSSCSILDVQDCVTCIWFRSGQQRGWCRSTGKCYAGNETGPAGGLQCPNNGDWQTSGANYFCRLPTNPLGTTENCQKCVSNDQRGTVNGGERSSNKIWVVAASDTGCYNYSSTLVKRFQYATTPTDCQILQAPTCQQCTSQTVGGGWCHDNQRCYQRNNYAPGTFYTCPSGTPYTLQSSGCNPSTAKCQTCHAQTDGAQRFGWCPSRNSCFTVDAGDARHEPANDTCNATQSDGQWLDDVSQCDVLAASTCSECVRHSFAGWCPAINKCFLKDDNLKPLNLECPATQNDGVWSLDENDCHVLKAGSCEECLTSGMKFAGWCAANSKCYRGTDHGPEGGLTCPERQWKWRIGQCASGARRRR